MSTALEATLQRSSRWSLIFAIILILLGLLAITLPTATSVGVVKVLAWLVIFDGFVQLVYAFQSEGVGRITWKLLVALLYLGAGVYLLANPLLGLAGLTLLLAILFFAEGVMDLTAYFVTRRGESSVSLLLHGILSIILGLVIWRRWPSDSFWVIGTIVGISMFLSGLSRLLMALEARKHARDRGTGSLAGTPIPH
jgi:uncharacterized membrane protein HdeD (DUF308 family)